MCCFSKWVLTFFMNTRKTRKVLLIFLQQHELLRTIPPNCTTCNRVMTLVNSGTPGKKLFRCPTHKSNKTPLRKDSYFYTGGHSSVFSWRCQTALQQPCCRWSSAILHQGLRSTVTVGMPTEASLNFQLTPLTPI
jgi:hypothetical protein